MSERRRHIVTDVSRPALPRHVRLRFDDLRQRWVVLAPEKVLWPDTVGLEVLQLCDGERTVAQIVDRLSSDYAAPRDTIDADVKEFVQSWTDTLLLTH